MSSLKPNSRYFLCTGIHESPDTEKGSWMNQIGTTTCIQPGQTEFGDSSMVYAEIDLKSGVYARRIVNI